MCLSLMHFIGLPKITVVKIFLMRFCDKEGPMKVSMSSILGQRLLKIASLKMRSEWQTRFEKFPTRPAVDIDKPMNLEYAINLFL